ncbi:glutamine--fructose-6-phosphate transaminase (isomerizing) [Frisingicoccus caecimuris]|uniref:Glutamine--fructose-6-phosphate aminotransferase [isomerizing] n=1 Tax=Frisingicoccus caecimuris TaxID=1796636 RepID=A0A4R2LHX2_9FIRM|nr:glutamine--fructose-6-phosphate transaminase (isomerizing) [Frisingicoccus caecimuris]MCR1918989.1 glutamine--fructose-6-phosphate transaminase (isomerizing) [Frisingicoccus caecimuris]TCO84766.1 glutamine--fructose-6-phosphate transaminase [Frisingicoccus caecimuris]
MCGIVGYIGKAQAAPILLDGLAKLEYRGYDSAGISIFDSENIQTVKTKGKIKDLRELTHDGADLAGTVGIGHTRWATHGEPSDANSHPHVNASETIAVVHNGIIENYLELKKRLLAKGYIFQSETDTEVVTLLLDYYFDGDLLKTLSKVMSRIEGSYALGIINKDNPDEIIAVKKDSPLIVGLSEDGNYIASDIPAVLKHTRKIYILEDGEIVKLTRDNVTVYNQDLDVVEKEVTEIQWDVSAAEKGGYQHFMMKEIHEQPKAVRDTIFPRIKEDDVFIHELRMTDEQIKDLKKVFIIACGSAYHAGVTGKYVIEELSRIPVEVDLASEFRYRNPILEDNTLAIIISQSGETADTLAAMREAKRHGVRTLAIVNVVGSSIAREADDVLYTWAGPEIAVATTKGYTSQLSALYLLALHFGKIREKISRSDYLEMIQELKSLPDKIEKMLQDKEKIQYLANQYIGLKDVFFLGRGIDYASALEASLKLKEISYVHSEAYAAGELKHGTISLIEDGTLVVALVTQEQLYGKIVSNIVEVKTRGAFVLAVTNEDNKDIEKNTDYVFYIPKTNKNFTGLMATIPMQLFAYYVAVAKGCDVDQPRNLAKSVTVE